MARARLKMKYDGRQHVALRPSGHNHEGRAAFSLVVSGTLCPFDRSRVLAARRPALPAWSRPVFSSVEQGMQLLWRCSKPSVKPGGHRPCDHFIIPGGRQSVATRSTHHSGESVPMGCVPRCRMSARLACTADGQMRNDRFSQDCAQRWAVVHVVASFEHQPPPHRRGVRSAGR